MIAPQPPPAAPARTLIDALLEEQRDLSAAERFARWHDSAHPTTSTLHRQLLPLSAPGPGEQYAFEVDLDRCSGCKSCVTACHALNGLDPGETWRSVGLLHGHGEGSFQQTITTACHHCADPACLNGCPVLAYDKDPLTGIVRHLDDQCIGCQYCVFMCPYEVPKYSERRGIVRKCDMCHQRLAHGESPACVQACPGEAIRITLVQTDSLAHQYRSSNHAEGEQHHGINRFLPASPDPALTLPSTRYLTERNLPADLMAGDSQAIHTQPAHPPLVWMLVLTQLSAGAFAILPTSPPTTRPALAGISLGAVLIGLAGSALHLGRFRKAWRVFLGLRKSWLSREILAFTLFTVLAAAATMFLFDQTRSSLATALSWITACSGVVAVMFSGMVYQATRRECWNFERSVGSFLSTLFVLGLSLSWAVAAQSRHLQIISLLLLPLLALARLAREMAVLRLCPDDADLSGEIPARPMGRVAYLLRFRLGGLLRVRLACGWIGGVLVPCLGWVPGAPARTLAVASFALCLLGETAGRILFFRSADAPKMPGNQAA